MERGARDIATLTEVRLAAKVRACARLQHCQFNSYEGDSVRAD
jgi:hypothetical protein